MAKDVAQRQLDQAGFRIANLGTPEAEGDATKTDNESTPRPAYGGGSPGTSLLAAAADHVHPASPGDGGGGGMAFLIDDPTLQEVSNERAIIFETAIDLADFSGDTLAIALSAIVQAVGGPGQVKLVFGGDAGQDDGQLLGVLDVTSPSVEVATLSARLQRPIKHSVLKVIALTESDAATLRVRGKSISVRTL